MPSGWTAIRYSAVWPTVTVADVGMAEITKLATPTVCESAVLAVVALGLSNASPE